MVLDRGGGIGVVLFDGECGLCQRSVQFIAARDPARVFRFAPLQSATARRLLAGSDINPGLLEGVLLIESDRVHQGSTAALRIARRLQFPWPLLWTAILLPRGIREPVYRFVARRRHRWWGPANAPCSLAQELRDRFLDPRDAASPPSDNQCAECYNQP